MTLLELLSLLLVLAGIGPGRVSGQISATQAPTVEPGEPGPAIVALTPDEQRREFIETHKHKTLKINQIRQGEVGQITSREFCSLEESILPASLSRGKYLSHNFGLTLYSRLIHDFHLFIKGNMLALATTHSDVHSGLFHTNTPHTCSLALLGHEALTPAELNEGETTLLSCSIIQISGETHCICRTPNVGLEAAQCLSMLGRVATTYSIEQTVTELTNLTAYPSFIAMNKDKIFVTSDLSKITCRDSALKISFMQLYMSYQRMTEQVQRLADMFKLDIPILDCEHDLVTLSHEELAKFILCVQSHEPSARTSRSTLGSWTQQGDPADLTDPSQTNSSRSVHARHKRDLLSALGLRDDMSGFVSSANAAIQTNFQKVQANELHIINQLKLEQAAVQKFMATEQKNADKVATQLSYLQSIYASSARLRHHRAMLVSAVNSLVFSFTQLSQELDQILELALSAMSLDKVACIQGTCIELKSLIIRKTPDGVQITAREAQIQSEIIHRLSCRIFPIGDSLYVHALNDAALLKFGDTFVDRATKQQIRPECINSHLNCPSSPTLVQATHLIQGNLYLSVHSGTLEAQCVKNTSIHMVTRNITCSATNPQVVTLPFIHNGHLLDTLHAHYYTSGLQDQKAFTEQELLDLEHNSKLPIITFDNFFTSITQSTFTWTQTNTLAIIVAACVACVAGLCLCGCCCPRLAGSLLSAIGKLLQLVGEGMYYILVQGYKLTLGNVLDHLSAAYNGRPELPASNRSCPVNVNNPHSQPHTNAEELARLRRESSDYNQMSNIMASAPAYPHLPAEAAPLQRQGAFSSKMFHNHTVNTGAPGVFESLVSYNPKRPQPINIAHPFPYNNANSNERNQTSLQSESEDQALKRLEKGLLK